MVDQARESSGTPAFAALLKRHRIAAALSQEALAERSGLSARAISDLERGVKKRPYLETVRMLADALDLTLPARTELARAARNQESPQRPEHRESTTSGLRGVIPLVSQTSLVGRDLDVAQVIQLLRRADLRLVTLIGPGGMGKTRLALAVAKAIQSEFPDGVWFIDLTTVTDPALVPSAIVQALGLSEAGGTPLVDQIVAFLHGKQILLVLDNLEHVIGAAPVIAKLIGRQSGAKVMVTSRMPLHVSGEQEIPVDPLALPEQGSELSDEIMNSPAISLFVQRAQAVRPGFTLTEGNIPDVAAICRRLDGLPLAIELAAARIKLMSPQSLLERLDHALSILTRGPIDQPDRQQAMHATIAWSYDLLDESERTLFRRLSVFKGGCTFESAEAVCNFDGTLDVFGGVASLVEKSVLRVEGNEPRFGMLVTIREFGREKLDQSLESQKILDRHAEYLIAFCRDAQAQLSGSEAARWFERLTREIGNVREAMTWLLEFKDPRSFQLINALEAYWWLTMQIREGESWLKRTLDLEESAEFQSLRAESLLGLGRLTAELGDFDGARHALRTAEALAGALDEAALLAQSLVRLGIVELLAGNIALAEELLVEGLVRCETIGDAPGMSTALIYMADACMLKAEFAQGEVFARQSIAIFKERSDQLGELRSLSVLGCILCERGEFNEAIDLFTNVLESWLEIGITGRVAEPLMNLAYATYLTGNHDAAAEFATEAILRIRESGRIRTLPYVLSTLASAAAARDDFDSASDAFREALGLASRFGDEYVLAEILDAIGVEMVANRDYQNAVQLFASATMRMSSIGASRLESKKRCFEESLRQTKDALGESEYFANWERGCALSPGDSVDLAIRMADSLVMYSKSKQSKSASTTLAVQLE